MQNLSTPAPSTLPPPDDVRAGVVSVRCAYSLAGPHRLVVGAVTEALARHGLAVRLGAPPSDPAGVRGTILVGPAEPVRDPCVLVDTRPPSRREGAAVWSDQRAGARSVVTHLIGLGHRRIAAIARAGDAAPPHSWLAVVPEPHRVRLVGDPGDPCAAGDPGGPGDPCDPGDPGGAGGAGEAAGWRAAHELLGGAEPPTAVVCGDDRLAAGVLRAAHERGLRVPKDLSVAGFDTAGLGAFTRPELTVVRHRWADLGHRAATVLLDLLGGAPGVPPRIELPADLVIRDSTGPVKGVVARVGS
ncbi:substrate-binding domain-containing protein [Dactylosporangium sp. AC04546]|uniref:LacI family DNA-binding transcriptional regulator n=1 Tax=Dactylosporangium sp. AC04546 TaxID=2862460 RepID=UPI002E7BD476|nr:substrate-binding domain-containing protein [Dactylosporangium sp. AC04546]WVK78666.1 substrate-binding domain-containing protein [Dactylosporangium sp. AC04546]